MSLQAPQQPPTRTKPPPVVMRECGICQSAIHPSESTHVCPTCALTFHAECWKENWGCAAYGCAQVNLLKPAHVAAAEALKQVESETFVVKNDFPWDYLMLGISALAMLVSALTFGVPSMLSLAATAARYGLAKEKKRWVLRVCAIVCVVGIFAGWLISRFWWLSRV